MENPRTRIPDLPTLLSLIRHRPGLYVGGRSVQGLGIYLGGFQFAEDWYDIADDVRFVAPLRIFERWVEANHNPERLTLRWFDLAAAAGSDAAGFDRWFEWHDAFTAEAARR